MQAEDRIKLFQEFFDENYISKIHENLRQDKKRVTIDLTNLIAFNAELADDLLDDPEETLRAADIAIEKFDDIGNVKGFKTRVRGSLPSMFVRIRDMRAKHLNKFITVEGTIETKTDVGVRMTSSKFECSSCGNILSVLQLGDDLKEPTRCACGRKKGFRMLQDETELMDVFTMRIQELASTVKYGSQMKIISVLCNSDLTDQIIEEKLIEGTKITINGIYNQKHLMKQGKKQTTLVTFLDANYIQISEESFYDIELNEKDIEKIKTFSKKPNLIKKICEGLFQGVYGRGKVKEGLVLQAFGGVSNYESVPKVRGDIHVLMVGDTGENKSVFLEYVSKFSPKCKLAVGKTVSAVGLSGAVIKDELSGSFVLKPGVIPLSNNGICAIDELDKMNNDDRDILHEPMEQQQISISKANLPDRKMLCRASFLVSMNPKNGYFNDYDPVYDQIDLPPTLVNRFDLVFILRKNREKTDEVKRQEMEKARLMMTRSDEKKQEKLIKFQHFMQKYIAYSRQNCEPTFDNFLSQDYIPKKYAEIDDQKKSTDPEEKQQFPISARHLFIIKRIAEARRRIFLGNRVLVEDVDYAIEKLGGSLEEFALNVHTGKIDEEYVSEGVSSDAKKVVESFDKFYEALEKDGMVSIDDLYEKFKEINVGEAEVEKFIEKKKHYGDLFYPRGERGGSIQRLR